MRVRRLTIKNFRGVESGTVEFNGHTLLVGGNNVGKSTICEALDLLLGPERMFRRPVVDEHDFHNGRYLIADEPNPIQIDGILLDLPEDMERKVFHRTRPWLESAGGFIDERAASPAVLDQPGVCRALPIRFLGWYDRKADEFDGQTFFAHEQKEVAPEDDAFGKPGAGLYPFGRDWKLRCGFVYLRTLRTGRRALSLERGSLLDTILRLGDRGKESMWEDTVRRLQTFHPPIGSIPQLASIRTQLQERMNRFVGLSEKEDATGFFASELTREHLREVVSLFVRAEDGGHLVPFHRLGTGSINALVFALLTQIADLRGKGSVIFAMEEPEIALPPHSQRRISRYLLRNMGQAIITSHSPYVLDEFQLDQILAVSRSAGVLEGTRVPTEGLKPKALARERRQLSEAVLSRGVVVTEGDAEASILCAASERMEELAGEKNYSAFDLVGISIFNARAQGDVPKWGAFFSALGKLSFAFHDKRRTTWTPEQTQQLDSYRINYETNHAGLEDLLVAEVPTNVLRRFLDIAATLPDYPRDLVKPAPSMPDPEVKSLAYKVLEKRKGDGYGALLIQQCGSTMELPSTIRAFLTKVHEVMKLPSLEEDASATRRDREGEPPVKAEPV